MRCGKRFQRGRSSQCLRENWEEIQATGPSRNYIGRIKEDFRFFDDLYPPVRRAIREANYEWNCIPIMTEQHSGIDPEELGCQIREKDNARFREKTRAKDWEVIRFKTPSIREKAQKYFK